MKYRASATTALIACLAVAFSGALRAAGSNPTEETAIRKIIAENSNLPACRTKSSGAVHTSARA
jgi:curli biogenesis system outer membrane secretion channel CsgG